MKNLIIIGPPASGKLSIAKRIASALGYFLFDNHRSLDACEVLSVDQHTRPEGLCHAIRKAVLQAAALSRTPLIFTMVYGHPSDEPVMREYAGLLTQEGPPLIVQLHCTKADALRRCQDASRADTSKITRPVSLEALYAKYDMDSEFRPESADVMHINTSTVSLDDAVSQVLERIRQSDGGPPPPAGRAQP